MVGLNYNCYYVLIEIYSRMLIGIGTKKTKCLNLFCDLGVLLFFRNIG